MHIHNAFPKYGMEGVCRRSGYLKAYGHRSIGTIVSAIMYSSLPGRIACKQMACWTCNMNPVHIGKHYVHGALSGVYKTLVVVVVDVVVYAPCTI